MNRRPPARTLLLALAAVAACREPDPIPTDRDSATDGSGQTDAPVADVSDARGGDGDTDASCTGPDGCFACTPQGTLEHLNRCTGTTCVPFDNAARLPRYNNGDLPPIQ